MPNEAVTIYVTKGAEIHGIRSVRATLRDEGRAADAIGPDGAHQYWRDATYWGTEFKHTLSEAIADAAARRTRKLASLEKQIAAIRAIDLTKPVEE